MEAVDLSRVNFVRAAGLVPIMFFGLYLLNAYRHGTAANALWICHVSMLFLGVGLLLGNDWLIRLSALWLVIGFPLWLYDAVRNGAWSMVSSAVHIVGLGLSVAVLRTVGAAKRIWLPAFLIFLILQEICRWLLPPNLNVNLAHGIRSEWSWAFGSYTTYWWVTSGVLLISLVLTNKLLVWIFPESAADSRTTESL